MSETASKHKVKAPTNLNFAIIICSSSRYEKLKAGEEVTDSSGDLISQVLWKQGHSVTLRTTVPDDKYQIEQTVKKALESKKDRVIPEEKIVFTVRLPKKLISVLRNYAKLQKQQLSSLVGQILEEYLNSIEKDAKEKNT